MISLYSPQKYENLIFLKRIDLPHKNEEGPT